MILRELNRSKFRILLGFAAAVYAGGAVVVLAFFGGSAHGLLALITEVGGIVYMAGWALFHCAPIYAILLAGRWTSAYHIVGAVCASNMAFQGAFEVIRYWVLDLPVYLDSTVGSGAMFLVSLVTGSFAFWLIAHADYSVLCAWFHERRPKNALKWYLATHWKAILHFERSNIRIVAGFLAGIIVAAVYVSWFLVVMDSNNHAVKTRIPFMDAVPVALIGIAIATLVLYLPLYLIARIGRWTCLHHVIVWPYMVNHTIVGIIVILTAMSTGFDSALHGVKEGFIRPTMLLGFEEILANAYVIPGALAFWLVAHADYSDLRLRVSRRVSTCMLSVRRLVWHKHQLNTVAFERQEAGCPSQGESSGHFGAAGSSSRRRMILLIALGTFAYLLGAAGWEGVMWAGEEINRMTSPFWYLYR